jgi:uncharacterized protein YodC (DUF2158 family)
MSLKKPHNRDTDMSTSQGDSPLKIGEVVRLKSGGHQMTVNEVDNVGVNCLWSDGKKTLQKVFAPAVLQRSNAISGISIQIVYGENGIESIVTDVQACASPAEEADVLHISVSELRRILKARLGPDKEKSAA